MSHDGGTRDNINASIKDESSTMTAGNDSDEGESQLSIDFSSRFVPYTSLSVGCLLFNGLALVALRFLRGPRTVHHRLLANLTIGDVVGTVLLWLYYNSPYLFPRFEVRYHLVIGICRYRNIWKSVLHVLISNQFVQK